MLATYDKSAAKTLGFSQSTRAFKGVHSLLEDQTSSKVKQADRNKVQSDVNDLH